MTSRLGAPSAPTKSQEQQLIKSTTTIGFQLIVENTINQRERQELQDLPCSEGKLKLFPTYNVQQIAKSLRLPRGAL